MAVVTLEAPNLFAGCRYIRSWNDESFGLDTSIHQAVMATNLLGAFSKDAITTWGML
jgi:hypothetical protein